MIVLLTRVKHILASVAAAIALSVSGLASVATVGATSAGTCSEVTRAVALGAGQPANQTVRGTLCVPAQYQGDESVDVLVHGASYNRTYWDWPTNGAQFSYVQRDLLAGRATFAYDQVGSGQSSHPLSATLSIATQGYVLHQLIGWLTTTQHYNTVNLVGHSYGSMVALNETAAYNDAKKLVLTGLIHTIAPGQALLGTAIYPAVLDPQFATSGFDLGYFTTMPGTRQNLFLSAGADTAVVAYDEAHKDVIAATVAATGLAEFFTPALLNVSQNVHIPVLIVVGTDDALFCASGPLDCTNTAAILQNEQPYFTHAPSLKVSSYQNTGHDIALYPSTNMSFPRIDSWIRTGL